MTKDWAELKAMSKKAMGEVDQISTNTFTYTTCCAANVYMFVHILIGAHIVPLITVIEYNKC